MPYEIEIAYPPPGLARSESSSEFYERELLYLYGNLIICFNDGSDPEIEVDHFSNFSIAGKAVLEDPFWISKITD